MTHRNAGNKSNKHPFACTAEPVTVWVLTDIWGDETWAYVRLGVGTDTLDKTRMLGGLHS